MVGVPRFKEKSCILYFTNQSWKKFKVLSKNSKNYKIENLETKESIDVPINSIRLRPLPSNNKDHLKMKYNIDYYETTIIHAFDDKERRCLLQIQLERSRQLFEFNYARKDAFDLIK